MALSNELQQDLAQEEKEVQHEGPHPDDALQQCQVALERLAAEQQRLRSESRRLRAELRRIRPTAVIVETVHQKLFGVDSSPVAPATGSYEAAETVQRQCEQDDLHHEVCRLVETMLERPCYARTEAPGADGRGQRPEPTLRELHLAFECAELKRRARVLQDQVARRGAIAPEPCENNSAGRARAAVATADPPPARAGVSTSGAAGRAEALSRRRSLSQRRPSGQGLPGRPEDGRRLQQLDSVTATLHQELRRRSSSVGVASEASLPKPKPQLALRPVPEAEVAERDRTMLRQQQKQQLETFSNRFLLRRENCGWAGVQPMRPQLTAPPAAY